MVLYVREIMEKDPVLVAAELPVREVAHQMAAAHHGFVVVAKDGRPWGIVTEWDIVQKIVAAGRDPGAARAEEIATTPLRYCRPTEPTDVVIQRMATDGIRRMLVLDEAGTLVGYLTSRTALRIFRSYIDKISTQIAGFQATL